MSIEVVSGDTCSCACLRAPQPQKTSIIASYLTRMIGHLTRAVGTSRRPVSRQRSCHGLALIVVGIGLASCGVATTVAPPAPQGASTSPPPPSATLVPSTTPTHTARLALPRALIDKTQSKYYAITTHWLSKVKQAFLFTGRKAEWQAYLDGLISTYSQRLALQAELKKL